MIKITDKSLATENFGDKKSQKDSPVIASQDRVLEQKLSFTCYVPENFNIEELINKNPPEFKYHKDKFHYILHIITDIPLRRKRDDNSSNFWEKEDYPYTCIYTPLLQTKIHDYKKYIKYLLDNNVLISDNHYIKGKKSKGYKFSSEFQTEIKPIPLIKEVFIRRILKFVDVNYQSSNSNSNISKTYFDFPKYQYLTRWFDDKLTIEYNNARKYINHLYKADLLKYDNEKAIRRKNHRRIVIEKIHNSCFIQTVDSTAGRLHTVLSQLKSELRQFVKYDGENLIAADLKNSQPFLSTLLFDIDKLKENNILKIIKNINPKYDTSTNPHPIPYYVSKNIEYYKTLVASGKLYEKFILFLTKEGVLDSDEDFEILRKKAKKGIISALFSPNTSISYNIYIKVFKNYFPDIYKTFRIIKYGHGRHNTLAIILQIIEAQLILGKICKIISDYNPKIPLFTLHDAIITTEQHIELVESVMKEVLADEIGLDPQIKREYWSA